MANEICEKCKMKNFSNKNYIMVCTSPRLFRNGYDNRDIVLCDKCLIKLYKFLGINEG